MTICLLAGSLALIVNCDGLKVKIAGEKPCTGVGVMGGIPEIGKEVFGCDDLICDTEITNVRLISRVQYDLYGVAAE